MVTITCGYRIFQKFYAIFIKINKISMEIKIYTLSSTRDPHNIRYVGKTRQPLKRRLSQHLTDAKKAAKTAKVTEKATKAWNGEY